MEREKIEKVRTILGSDGGMKVPEGFFESRFKEIQESLPPYPETPKAPELSFWHKIRPYVYMAAMFAGIWLMMQVFHRVSAPEQISLDNIPAQIAQAMSAEGSEHEISSYMVTAPADDYELEADVAQAYGDMASFEKAFGYELEPQYADMKVE